MTTIRAFGRMPTLAEMKEYYAREDVLSFLYDECRMRNIDIAFRGKRWPINPQSKAHLREIIDETIKSKIETAYKNSAGSIDTIRLEKFDYLSFHFRTSITSGKKLTGFDVIFEADLQGWRRSFEDLCGVIKLLDDFGVCYRMKYSGVRSLHFMMPCESFPKQFDGESILNRRVEIQGKIQDYFRRHCGMERAHGGSVMRLAYSLNEDNGLVSLPLSSDELPFFRPWEANIHNVTVDKPWHGDVPPGSSRRMLEFLRAVYNDDVKSGKRKKNIFNLEIVPKVRSGYASESGEYSIEKWSKLLKSDEEATRVEAAWNLMTMPEAVPISVLEEGLADENPDVRWYLTESLQKRLDDDLSACNAQADAVSLARRMLLDDDQFVRISAIDVLALAGENALSTLWDCVANDVSASKRELFSDVIYAINKIGVEYKSKVIKSFAESECSRTIAHSLQKVTESGQFLRVRRYIQQVRELCRRFDVEDSMVFSEAIRLLVPKLLRGCGEGTTTPHLYVSILQEIRKNEVVPLMTVREMANFIGIDSVKIPGNRMTEAERKFLQSVVKNVLTDMSIKQKARILVLFMLYGKTRLMEPSARVLLRMGIPEAVEAMAQVSMQKDVLPYCLLSAVNLLKQIEPSIEKSLSADKTLVQTTGDAPVRALVEMLRDEDRIVRHSAVQALGRIGNLAAASALIEVFGDKGRLTGNVAISAMAKVGQPAIPALIKALREDGNMLRRARSALALGRIGGPTVVPALIEALQDRHGPVRYNAVKALWGIGAAAAVPALIEALEDKLMGVRCGAAKALGAISDRAAAPALTEALRDENEWVRRFAAEALRNIGTTEAIKAANEFNQ